MEVSPLLKDLNAEVLNTVPSLLCTCHLAITALPTQIVVWYTLQHVLLTLNTWDDEQVQLEFFIPGDTIGIPDPAMGLTFVALGTGVPDALSSVFVARDGECLEILAHKYSAILLDEMIFTFRLQKCPHDSFNSLS